MATHAFERLGMLDEALASVRDGSLLPDRLVVVVDHNPELLALLVSRLGPDVEVVGNTGPKGLGAARNTGVAHLGADVDVVAFLDDDATADRRWLELIVAPFDDPSVWGVGGWAESDWEGGRPAWFPPSFDWVIGCSWEGLDRRPGAIRNPIGCSMAFRREAFDLLGGFRADMGRVGNSPVGCEETEFAIRLGQERPGARVVLAPDAVVTQVVPRARSRASYFVRRCLAEGRSKASMVLTTGAASGLSEERRHVVFLLRRAFADAVALRLPRAFFILLGGFLTASSYARARRRVARSASVPAGPSSYPSSAEFAAEVSAALAHCPRCRATGCTVHQPGAPSVTLVIPTRNEARNLPWVLSRVPAMVTEVVLVDGGSTDETVETARHLRPDVRVVGQPAPGKGAAIASGLMAATGDVVVMIDADGSMDPLEVPLLVSALVAGADVVKGSRRMSGAGSVDISHVRALGNWGLSKAANLLYGTRWSELNYGLAAFHRDVLPALGVPRLVSADPPSPPRSVGLLYRLSGLGRSRKVRYGHGFEIETLLFTRAIRAGLRVTEVASFEYERRFGSSNLSTWRDGFRVLGCMLAERVYRPASR